MSDSEIINYHLQFLTIMAEKEINSNLYWKKYFEDKKLIETTYNDISKELSNNTDMMDCLSVNRRNLVEFIRMNDFRQKIEKEPISEEEFHHFIYENFKSDLMNLSPYIGSPTEVLIELNSALKKGKIFDSEEPVLLSLKSFDEKYDIMISLFEEFTALEDINLKLTNATVFHILFRHFKIVKTNERDGTTFADDLYDETSKSASKLFTLINDIANIIDAGDFEKGKKVIYHENQLYTVIINEELDIHTIYPILDSSKANQEDRLIKQIIKEKDVIYNYQEIPEKYLL
ncbi:hypothetical protein V9L05_09240 [Bernardetia sp. Wsw4-3y2]|uniref:hypothetical protein n=1 Tax=Bernardetia sp. Wsw4-3y2 TaxID=3127471 RepID=UPI0030CEC254